MLGPIPKYKIYMSCEGCDCHRPIWLKGGKIMKSRTVHYCTNFQGNKISNIKKYPKTPKWCPVEGATKE